MNLPVVDSRKGTEPKVNVLTLAKELGNVSKACKLAGYSRDSFYRFKKRFEAGGVDALADISRRKPLLKNRVLPEVEAAVVELALLEPRFGQVKVAAELGKRGLGVSAAGVRCVWLRHGLQTTELRLQAIARRADQASEPPAALESQPPVAAE